MEGKFRRPGQPDSMVAFYRRISVEARGVYYVLIGSVAVLFLLSFVIKADVGVTARGILSPASERVILTAPFEGVLSSAVLTENRSLGVGDTVFSVRMDKLEAVDGEIRARLAETDTLLSDLRGLLGGKLSSGIVSRYYRAESKLFASQLSELRMKEATEKKTFERYRKLFEDRMVSLSEFEKKELSYENIRSEIVSFRSRKRAQWESEVLELEKERREIREKLSQIGISASESAVVSPVEGVILNVFQVKDGQYVHQGQSIVEISPGGDLMAECRVRSSDIGLLSEGQSSRIMVDAFNYNDWGVLEGKITEIYDDVHYSDQGCTYKLYCSLDRDYMELGNGYRRGLKKGMTVTVRFVVARRSLFSLAFERLNDWLNPEVLC